MLKLMNDNMDFGTIITGDAKVVEVGKIILDEIIAVASGKLTKRKYREG